jgi:hypothetical protein
MGSEQISGHALPGDSAEITKICSDPTLRSLQRLQNQLGGQAVGEDLVLQKPSANTREHRPRISWRMHRAPCYRFFIPRPFTTRWASRMVRHGLKAVPSTLFYMPNKPLTQ